VDSSGHRSKAKLLIVFVLVKLKVSKLTEKIWFCILCSGTLWKLFDC